MCVNGMLPMVWRAFNALGHTTLHFLLQAHQGADVLTTKVFDANNVVATSSFADVLRAYCALHDIQG